MGAKQSSTGPRMRTYSGSGQSGPSTGNAGNSGGELSIGGGSASAGQATAARARARSLGSFHPSAGHSPSLSIPNNNGSGGVSAGLSLLGAMSPDSDSSTPEDAPFGRSFTHSLPVHLSFFTGLKCPVCSKSVAADELECHLVICLTKPRISYNEDVLTEDKGECVICLEDLKQGDTIARLPCLCIYHKMCIDRWFEVNRSCPEHPSD
ncbi:E3 ubiquitin-protein ligase ZNRF2-like [Argonauta hians]